MTVQKAKPGERGRGKKARLGAERKVEERSRVSLEISNQEC